MRDYRITVSYILYCKIIFPCGELQCIMTVYICRCPLRMVTRYDRRANKRFICSRIIDSSFDYAGIHIDRGNEH